MVWSDTKPKPDGSAFTDEEFNYRVPLPKFSRLKKIELDAASLTKHNKNVQVNIVCSGFVYGNGE